MKTIEPNKGLRKVLRILFPKLMQGLFGMRFEGEERVPRRGPGMIVANHSSYFDIPALFWKYPSWVYFVAKKELFRGPFAPLYRWWGAIPIDRDKPSLSSVRKIMECLSSNRLVGIFPQGKRVSNLPEADRVPARTGVIHFAERFKAPIIPMAIRGRFRLRSGVTVICGEPFFMRLEETTAANRHLADYKAELLINYIYDLRDSETLPPLPRDLALDYSELSLQQKQVLAEMYRREGEA